MGAMRAEGRFISNVLVDGVLRATWWLERDGRRRVILAIRPFREFSATERTEVGDEAARLVELVGSEAAARDVRFEPAVG